MLVTIGEEREHFGYDAIRDKYVDDKKVQKDNKNKDKKGTDNVK